MVKIARRLRAAFFAVTIATSAWAPASAGTATGTMGVSLIVEEACHLDVRPLRFDTILSGTGAANSEGSLSLACPPETEFVVSLDDGRHGADGARRMAGTDGGTVSYELYSDAARTRRWGAGPRDAVAGQITHASAVTLPIYARALAARADAGVYSDIVTVTVSF